MQRYILESLKNIENEMNQTIQSATYNSMEDATSYI